MNEPTGNPDAFWKMRDDEQRRVLKTGYLAQLPQNGDGRECLCFHLAHLLEMLSFLSGLKLIRPSPFTLGQLCTVTHFVCVGISIESIRELLASEADEDDTWRTFLKVWNPLQELVRLICSEKRDRLLANSALHSLLFGAVTLCLIAKCGAGNYELESEWTEVFRELIPGARFDGSANEDLVCCVSRRLWIEVGRIKTV